MRGNLVITVKLSVHNRHQLQATAQTTPKITSLFPPTNLKRLLHLEQRPFTFMEEAEKMVALKKAYADTILNTAKEAAARIMISEQKALRFQRDLCFTKDEALRMLLRLKQMIDSKATEVQITSLNQQRRIEELEAQLDEAEETILDLRSELKQAHDQLDKVKSNNIVPFKGPTENQDGSFKKLTNSDPNISSPSDLGTKHVLTSAMKGTPSNQIILDGKCCTSAKQTTPLKTDSEKFCVENPDLASIIVRNKELEQYRNGYTQRIRAFERNDVEDQQFIKKGEPTIIMNEQNIEICTVPSPKTQDVDGLEEVPIHNSTVEDQPARVCKKRRRKFRFRKSKAKKNNLKCTQPWSVLSRNKTNSNVENDNAKSGEGACTLPCAGAENANSSGLEENEQKNKDQILRGFGQSLREGKVEYRDTITTSCSSLSDQLTRPCQPCSLLSHCKTTSVNFNVIPGEDILNTESDARIKTDIDPISGSMNVTECTKTVRKSRLAENATDEDTELIDEAVLAQECDALKSPSVSGCKLNLEMDKVALTDSDLNNVKTSEATNRAPSQTDSSRLLKYTFSRKRKKESSANPDENTSLGNITTNRRVCEKQNGPQEPRKSSLIDESSRDSRRLVQVARQLISLSGKSWW